MPESARNSDLEALLLAVIRRGAGASLPASEFDALARAVFTHQFACNPIYRAYCEARGKTPTSVDGWEDVPAVPTDAFKAAPLSCGDPAAAEVVFRTSGTTRGSERRGTHYMLDTSLYRAALRAGFRTYLLPEGRPMRICSLVPSFSEVPDSSLSFMIDDLVRAVGAAGSTFVLREGELDVAGFVAIAREAATHGEPILVAGTSFAFVHLLDALAADSTRIALPAGSRVMDTGGFKGRSRTIEKAELYRMIEEGLGVPATHIVNEYGMTEMSSQFYDGVAGRAAPAGAPRRHALPPWVRSVAVDPETLEPLPAGSPGVLRHVDLANLHSVMALQTADLGTVTDEGVELRGRAEGAEARGCSIAMDELLEVMRRG